jgi:hypothetical protein
MCVNLQTTLQSMVGFLWHIKTYIMMLEANTIWYLFTSDVFGNMWHYIWPYLYV